MRLPRSPHRCSSAAAERGRERGGLRGVEGRRSRGPTACATEGRGAHSSRHADGVLHRRLSPSSTGSPRAVGGRTVTSATRSSCRPHRSRPQTHTRKRPTVADQCAHAYTDCFGRPVDPSRGEPVPARRHDRAHTQSALRTPSATGCSSARPIPPSWTTPRCRRRSTITVRAGWRSRVSGLRACRSRSPRAGP